MKPMKTPGVYIVEKSAFPNSVVQVATAVPAFIGYTQRAMNGNKSLTMQPWRISSMTEFHDYFGAAHAPEFELKEHPGDSTGDSELSEAGTMMKDSLPDASFEVATPKGAKKYQLQIKTPPFCMYGAMRLFFQNGGGACYIVSVGNYEGDDGKPVDIDAEKLMAGIDLLIKEPEPTMVVIPETTRLIRANAVKVQQKMLQHCGFKMKSRIALLDIFGGYRDRQDPKGDPIATFRNDIGINHLDYGTAYYPWVNTAIFQPRDFTFENITDATRPLLIDLLKKSANPGGALPADQVAPTMKEIEYTRPADPATPKPNITAPNSPITVDVVTDDNGIDPGSVEFSAPDKPAEGAEPNTRLKTVANVGQWTINEGTGAITLTPDPAFKRDSAPATVKWKAKAESGAQTGEVTVSVGDPEPSVANIDKTLRAITPLYTDIMTEITMFMNTMAPSAAMAGVYTMVDSTRGVWKAPANVSLNSVTAPTVNVSHDDQEDLNVTPQGKSINAIRPFVGEGTLVWGARTLDGNSLDWRYVSVRRTMIMLEESIRLASKAYVFEPNVANTWVTMKAMIENFLYGIWKQGGLAGAVPEDAYSVHVGLGDTMTPVDILEGILRITVLVAVSRPAEFIEITFQQQMQKS